MSSGVSLQARQPLINNTDAAIADEAPFQRVQSREPSPESQAGLISFLTFGWFTPIIDLAFARNQQQQKLEPTDLYPLVEQDTAEKQFQRLYDHWEAELQSQQPSLMRALRKTFLWEVAKTAWLQLCCVCLQFVAPFLLHKILDFVHDPSASFCPFGAALFCIPEGYIYAVSLVAASFFQGCLSAHYFQRGYRNGMHIRASLILLAYHKSMKVLPWAPPPPAPPEPSQEEQRRQQRRFFRSRATRPQQSPAVGGMGQITNIISTDTDRFTFLMPYFNVMWSGAVQIVVAFVFLIAYVGWAVFAGVIVMILMTTLSSFVQTKGRKIQAKVMKAKDERLKLEVEMLKIVKIIKLYAWENTIEDQVRSLRKTEMALQLKFKLLNVVTFLSFSVAPVLVSLATFTCYTVFLGHDLDAETAFPALSLFNILRFPLAMMPMVVGFYMQAKVAKDRMEAFFLSPEVPGRPNLPPAKGNAIELKASQLVWPDRSVLLNKVNFFAKKGEFVVVVGKTGAGKSGLLYALLGELPISENDGSTHLSGSVGYCAQSAWVRNASLKSNLIGGSQFEADRYDEVLDACALRADLAALPQGDDTMIGDRGINLSGGQKQRVALARAVFANKDVYVLDDVLSALDAHVTAHICTNLLQGPLMRGKTVVLVTHSRHAMRLADRIYWISDKEVKCFDTFEEFRSSNVVDQLEEKEEKERKAAESAPDTNAKGEKSGKGSTPAKKEKAKATQQEERRAGSVSKAVYFEYMKACGGILPVGCFLVTVAMSEGSKNLSDGWLTKWTKMGGTGEGSAIYALIALGSCLCSCTYVVTRILLGQKGSRTLHEGCVNALLRAKMTFYDQTPNGQILNRLAEDTSILDNNLPQTMAANLVWFWKAGAIVVMCMLVGWYLIFLLLPMFFIYGRIAKRYLPAVRDLRRLDAAARSPIFSHFSETIAGVTTIRAMEEQQQAISCNMSNLECQMEAYFLNNTAARWLTLRLQLCGTALVGSVCIVGVNLATRGILSAGILGLAITYAMNLSDTLSQVNRESADRETQMVSVERVHSYISSISREADLVEPPEARPPQSFMSRGEMIVENVVMNYRPELPTVLNGISLKIRAGERIGIVGRTGCGKSSFLSALMRLVEVQDGHFEIDGVDLKTIGLHTLRSKVAIIPQDPAILTGTVRFNLDPFGSNSDDELWSVLEKSQLMQRVKDAGGLDSKVEEGGGNYSVGELQLLCMARALLRQKAFANGGGLLLLDEATSALDSETDAVIQKIIRQDFKCTTITIAHRIQTLLDYDRVAVLAAGQVVEFDAPKALLEIPSQFQSLALEGGVDLPSSAA